MTHAPVLGVVILLRANAKIIARMIASGMSSVFMLVAR